MKRFRNALVVGLVLSSTLLVGGIAQAEGLMMQVPGADGVIHACFEDDGGKLRVIDPQLGITCKREETPLQWNQTGPQGPKGDAGAPGPAGAPGLSGYQQVTQSINNFSLAAQTESVHVLSCPDGKKVLGGGFLLFDAAGFLANNSDGPVNESQWGISMFNPSATGSVTIGTVTFYAICANAS
jgi:hypothetical protein